ncbi:MAG: hypothetical protein ACE5JR_08160 [Gemmatimonadota bacterium]
MRRFALAAVHLWGATLLLAGGGAANAQEVPSRTSRVAFASMDVSLGGTLVDDADPNISYGAGTDIANLILPRTLFRVGFRFWSGDDTSGPRTVEIDDFTLSLMLRKRFTDRGVSLYGGLGPGLHFVAARFDDRIAEKERRDAFRLGVDGQFGLEFAVGEDGFVNAFAEATGSLVDKVSHLSLQGGLRLRFDSLGRR